MRPPTLLTDDDLCLFNEGSSHLRLYEKLGAHPLEITLPPLAVVMFRGAL